MGGTKNNWVCNAFSKTTHTNFISLSLSLSVTHTHTHTHVIVAKNDGKKDNIWGDKNGRRDMLVIVRKRV